MVVASGVMVARSGKNVPVVSLFRRSALEAPNSETSSSCEANGAVVTTPEYNQAVAVAFNPLRPFQLVALLREPAQLLVAELDTGKQVQETLSERSMRDTGHAAIGQAWLTDNGVAQEFFLPLFREREGPRLDVRDSTCSEPLQSG